MSEKFFVNSTRLFIVYAAVIILYSSFTSDFPLAVINLIMAVVFALISYEEK